MNHLTRFELRISIDGRLKTERYKAVILPYLKISDAFIWACGLDGSVSEIIEACEKASVSHKAKLYSMQKECQWLAEDLREYASMA